MASIISAITGKGTGRLIKRNREYAIKHNLPTLAETFELNKDKWHLSGFKPLSERFNPDWFRPAALEQERNKGVYTKAPWGSKSFKTYWETQLERVRNGYKVHGFTCPGDLYYFLNFYVLPVVKVDEVTGTPIREMGHPNFWDVHYYFSHYVEWGRKSEKDGVCVKPRGVGWSEFVANMGVRMYTGYRDSTTFYGASAEPFLIKDGILTKAWRQLEYQNSSTQRGFKKLRQVYDGRFHKRASKRDREGNESGWGSEILGVVVDAPNKVRGTRTNLLVLEEGGSFKQSKKAVMTAKALTTIGGVKFGYLIIFGTGGDESSSGESLQGLIEMFYKPNVFGMLGVLNRYNEGKEIKETGFFFATYEAQQKFMNSQGITDIQLAHEAELKVRKQLEDNGAVKELQDYKAEFPFIPEEAFAKSGTNIFNKIKIANQKVKLKSVHPKLKPERGELEWVRKEGTNKITGVKWIPLATGRIQILEHPERDSFGETLKNLYISGIDSIDFGVDTSLIGEAGSKFSMLVKKKFLHPEKLNNIYVAEYTERPKDERMAFEVALKMAIYYNLKINVERTRKEVISYFRQHHMLRFMAKQPSIINSDVNASKHSNNYGTPINPKVIIHYLNSIKDYVEDFCDMVFFEDLLDELNGYAYELKTKFDRIAAMGMCELLDEEFDAAGLNVKGSEEPMQQMTAWGYYTDENGYKRFGILPGNQTREFKDNMGFPDIESLEKSEQDTAVRWVNTKEEPTIGSNENALQFEL